MGIGLVNSGYDWWRLPNWNLPQRTVSNDTDLVVGSFANEAGERQYKVYLPKSYSPTETQRYPLVVLLHGCRESAEDFFHGSKMAEIAERDDFIILLPIQDRASNMLGCWNWFLPEHQQRNSGEPSIIAGIVNKVKNDYRVEANKIYLAGLSAGGGMTAILGACYTDLFAAIAVHSGPQFKSATTVAEAYQAMASGSSVNPAHAGELGYRCSGTQRKILPTLVFQGDRDGTVAPVNGEQVFAQFAHLNDWQDDGLHNGSIDLARVQRAEMPGQNTYDTTTHTLNANGKPLLILYSIHGLAHAWSGGDGKYPYNDPQGPSASELMWNFFKQYRR